jgi:hypothetical protein
MANLSDFLPVAGGGGGGIPKYQEFTTSGTFTPSQALIDSGGRMGIFIVGGGGGGSSNAGGATEGGGGAEVLMQYITLTNTNSVTVTIGSGGGTLAAGGSTTFSGSSAGGVDVVALGGAAGKNSDGPYHQNRGLSTGFAAIGNGTTITQFESATTGIFGYGSGGATYYGVGVRIPKDNSGSGGGYNQSGGDGFVRLTWFE